MIESSIEFWRRVLGMPTQPYAEVVEAAHAAMRRFDCRMKEQA